MTVTWPGKLPAETDPLMMQSMRTDIPASLEAQVVDEGVAEGRPERGDVGGVVWLFVILFAILLVAGVIANWPAWFP